MYDRPEDRLKQIIIPRIQRVLGRPINRYYREFWALQDITLDIFTGETVGIIGRNGAGKSTLLQILCSTLHPTHGSVTCHGRIAALLELGSGFNSEFTGRENVYLNATVLGLTKKQIDERFDAIATFADIGEFIDQPVKTYSSGMLVRLAFAVIAYVDADILVIDEALAVGDAIFTQKCMRFLRKFKETGTLIFVSHDIHSVIALCDRVLWLDRGKCRMLGAGKEVAESYLQYTLQETYGNAVQLQANAPTPADVPETAPAPAKEPAAIPEEHQPTITLFNNLEKSSGWQTGTAKITQASLTSPGREPGAVLRGGDLVTLTIEAQLYRELSNPIIGFCVKDRLGQILFAENTFECPPPAINISDNTRLTGTFVFKLPLLPSGTYAATVAIADGTPNQNIQHHWIHEAIIFSVIAPKPWLGLMGIPFQSVRLTASNHSA